MRHALSTPNVGAPGALVRLATDAEAAGWDGCFCWDHLHLVRAMALEVHDPWVLLGAMAEATERVRLGTLVTPLARRRPWIVAKEVVTLDHLSGGRAVLGVGLGTPADDEFGAFGEPIDDRPRADLLDEGLELLDGFLTGTATRHRGAHYEVDAHLRPGSLQRPRPPIWVAAGAPNRRPLERARRYDGVAPIRADGEPLAPDELATYLEGFRPPPGFDVVVTVRDDVPTAEYADAGATWCVVSRWPTPGFVDELRDLARSGPPS